MASQDKQQKRAQRAKAKAKQNRSGKAKVITNVVHSVLSDPLINEPFDDVNIDLNAFNFRDIEQNGFDPADFDDLFQAMQSAEKTSVLALCVVFLQYPVLELVVSEEPEEAATAFMMSLLIAYRQNFHNEDEDRAEAWIRSDLFQQAFGEASRILQEKTARSALA